MLRGRVEPGLESTLPRTDVSVSSLCCLRLGVRHRPTMLNSHVHSASVCVYEVGYVCTKEYFVFVCASRPIITKFKIEKRPGMLVCSDYTEYLEVHTNRYYYYQCVRIENQLMHSRDGTCGRYRVIGRSTAGVLWWVLSIERVPGNQITQ